MHASAGRLSDAARLADAATAGEMPAPPEARSRAALARTAIALLRDDLAGARAWAGRARAAAGATDDVALWRDVLFWEVAALDALGESDDASARLAEARDSAGARRSRARTPPRSSSTACGCCARTAATPRRRGRCTR